MKFLVVASAVGLLVIALVIFSRMGGEFLPTLEEGDFAVETRVLTGSSLSYTVDAATKGAEVLLREFPDEVKEVVGKIGSSEIPTDPMPIEACDLMVILKPKGEWVKAHSREELAEKMGEALEEVPGVLFGFQQPIQMRFNELISGVRQDVAVKVFGEDLTTLATLADQIGKVAGTVEGVKDIYVEQVDGLPQIVISINRDEVAKYGLDIETVNQTINSAFAGQVAGTVFEGEKRFDLTVRLASISRQGIEDVRNLFITSAKGEQIPLKQLAEVEFKIGPNQIQREDAKRRIIVAFNARGRDIASIVKELQGKIDKEVDFPTGYYPTYGGQFENLQEAQARLSIALPAALLLIFLLLFFTFHSVKQSILIFTAIPMAAVGGVLALLLRGMPFSISAGIGFIALFGVAVLNGIVLIAEFNRLKAEGETDLESIVLKGTSVRLRPVLMTAAVASLGFMPMALATSAGAEVQKPLATVVIGGLITSTALTLIVLPCLYIYFERIGKTPKAVVATIALLLLLGGNAIAQEKSQEVGLFKTYQELAENNPSQVLLAKHEKGSVRITQRQDLIVSTSNRQTIIPYGNIKGYSFNGDRYRASGERGFLRNYGYYKILDDSCIVTYARKNRAPRSALPFKYYYSESLTAPVKNAYRKKLRSDFGDQPEFYTALRNVMKDNYQSLFKPVMGNRILFNKLYCETIN